jgi:hypothetical protein
VRDGDCAAGGAGDGCGPGIDLDRSGIGEAGPVVAELGQDTGSGVVGQPGEAGDDGVVGVLVECLGCGLPEFVDVAAFGVEDREQRERLAAQGVLDQVGLPQLWLAERGVQLCGGRVDAALVPASAQRGRDRQDRAGIGRSQVAGHLAREGLEGLREVLAQQ